MAGLTRLLSAGLEGPDLEAAVTLVVALELDAGLQELREDFGRRLEGCLSGLPQRVRMRHPSRTG